MLPLLGHLVPRRVSQAVARAGIVVTVGPGLLGKCIVGAATRAAEGGVPASRRAPRGRDRARPGRCWLCSRDGSGRPPRVCPASVSPVSGTHLAVADDTGNGPLAQDARFGQALARLGSEAGLGLGPDGVRRHLAGERRRLRGGRGALGRGPDRDCADGLVPDALTVPGTSAGAAARLRPVMALLARPVRVESLPAGHGVSYGPSVRHRAAVADRDPPGGLRRWMAAGLLGPDRGAPCAGRRVPLVGRVAMDAVTAHEDPCWWPARHRRR